MNRPRQAHSARRWVLILHQEHILDGMTKYTRDPVCQRQRRVVLALLEEDDRLPSHRHPIRQFLLGEPVAGAKLLNPGPHPDAPGS